MLTMMVFFLGTVMASRSCGGAQIPSNNSIEQHSDQQNFKKKVLKNVTPFRVTLNHAFEEVIDYCADAPFRKQEATWIVDDMQQAYINLHQQGYAHSIEVWQEQTLVGGLYGVAINGFFLVSPMFYTQSNASKVALVALASLLKSIGVKFIDCQLINPFLASMGCIEVSRADSFNKNSTV